MLHKCEDPSSDLHKAGVGDVHVCSTTLSVAIWKAETGESPEVQRNKLGDEEICLVHGGKWGLTAEVAL